MCDPVSIALAATTTLQGVMQYQQQNALRASAEASLANEQAALTVRQQQERAAAGQSKFDNAIEAAKARSNALAGAASSNVSGNSVDAIARDYYFQQGRIDAATDLNARNTYQQLEAEKRAAQYRRDMNYPKASLAALGLNIATGVVGAYNNNAMLNASAGKK